jgi:glycosyltransferase involved in cell wall biosynthesis
MKNEKVFYVSDINPETLVFHSQVLGMVEAWSQVGQVTLLYHTRKHCNVNTGKFEVIESKGWPNIIRLLWRMEIMKNNWHKHLTGCNIIHCRDAVAAWMALKAIPRKVRRNCKIIFDCRGASVEELNYMPRNFIYTLLKIIRRSEYRSMERFVTNQADFVLAVSERLSQYLLDRYGRKADQVIHSIIDGGRFRFSPEHRQVIRHRLGLGQEKVFIYVGSYAGWQRLDILGQWWPRYSQKNPTDHLLVLTDNPAEFMKATGIIEEPHRYNIMLDSVPHAEIPGYMSAADYGIIFRDGSLVNQVSSPVKLSEYLAAGLLVITNQDYFTEIDSRSIFLIDPGGDDTLPGLRFNDNERADRSEYWSEHLSSKNAVKRIIEFLYP